MTEIELLQEINKKLDILIGLYAIQGKDLDVQIEILKSLGMKYKDISRLTGIAEVTLRVRAHRKK